MDRVGFCCHSGDAGNRENGKYINLETRSSLDSGGHLNRHDDKDDDMMMI